MNEAARKQPPVVTGSQVIAAGLASAAAAVVTSRFGVAGTLLGAAVTSMIITGGSAILKAYLESFTGSVKKVPQKMRAQRNRRQAGRGAAEAPETPETLPGRPDLRQNFVGRLRAAFGWFSHLPRFNRRSIMVKGLIGALVAFVIGVGAITAVEAGVLGNSLSCGIWGTCAEGQTPGVGGGSSTGSGGGSSTLGDLVAGGTVFEQETQPTVDPETGQPVDPGTGEPVDPNTGQPVDPAVPAEPVPEEPVAPAPAEPAEPAEPVPGQEAAPSGAEQAAPLE